MQDIKYDPAYIHGLVKAADEALKEKNQAIYDQVIRMSFLELSCHTVVDDFIFDRSKEARDAFIEASKQV